MSNAEHWIRTLELEPHPEGGWFREVYRSQEVVAQQHLPGRFSGERCFSTAIYFLLRSGDVSAFHRIKQDELWHFYDGSSVSIHAIDPGGNSSTFKLGRNSEAGETLMAVVPAGWLFGATVAEPDSFGLLGCTVAPGFDFADFEMPSRDQLLAEYPQHEAMIEKLSK